MSEYSLVKTLLVRAGSATEVRAIAFAHEGSRDYCAIFDFFKALRLSNPQQLSKVSRTLTEISNAPGHLPAEHFKRLAGTEGLFEIRSDAVRLLCFWDDGRVVVCTHGFLKKTPKTPAHELEQAAALRRRYFAAKAAGELVHEEFRA